MLYSISLGPSVLMGRIKGRNGRKKKENGGKRKEGERKIYYIINCVAHFECHLISFSHHSLGRKYYRAHSADEEIEVW